MSKQRNRRSEDADFGEEDDEEIFIPLGVCSRAGCGNVSLLLDKQTGNRVCPKCRASYGRTLCGKKCYDKRGAQTLVNARTRQHTRKRPDRLRIYHCPRCDAWHLTHRA